MVKIVVFGGSGSLGSVLVERLLKRNPVEVLVVGRNEGKLVSLKEKFPSISIMVGDIADPWVVKKAMTDASEVYLAAALKHVGIAERDTKSCVSSNVIGALNVIQESLVQKPFVLVFISTDKAAQPNGVYGCSKRLGESLMEEAERINPDTTYRVVRYGNVWGSEGSIGTKWKPKMENGQEVILTDPEATRFFWTMNEAVDLIFESIKFGTSAKPFIPKMRSIKMGAVLQACLEVWTKNGSKSPVKVIGLQPGENKHETTDGITFSNECEQFGVEEFKHKFLLQ
jgi:UDP-N-acetylglucosamine 4,6-dehydratase